MAKIILQNVRCSYVYITEPRADTNGDLKYSMQILINKDDKQMDKIRSLVVQAAKEKFGDKVNLKSLKMPVRNGEEMDGDEYENCNFINANNARKPGIVNKKIEPADQDDLDEYCYSGAYFNVSINFYGFDSGKLKGVAAGLQNVMLVKKGEHLGSFASAQDDFAGMSNDLNDDVHNDDDLDDLDF